MPLIESLLLWSLHSHPSVVLQAMHLFKIMLLQALQLPQGCLKAASRLPAVTRESWVKQSQEQKKREGSDCVSVV